MVALAPLVSDAPLIIIILLLLKKVPLLFVHLISIAGGIFVIYLAWQLFTKWRKDTVIINDAQSKLHTSLGQAVLINYLSPGPYLFWTLVNGPILLQALQVSIYHGIAFLLSFYALFIGAMLVLAVVFSQAKRLGDKVVRILTLVSAILLGIFGLILVYQGLNAIL